MSLLLDTHLIVWSARWPERLSQRAHSLLSDPSNLFYFSSVSIWEIAIKQALGRGGFDVDARYIHSGLLRLGYRELTLTGLHGLAITELPPIHQDPFDRILIAQAITEGITLVTADATVARYPGPILKV